MTVVESPKGRASHNLGNRGAIPTFPPPGYCYIFFQNLSRKESSSPPAPSLFRLILRLEKTGKAASGVTVRKTSRRLLCRWGWAVGELRRINLRTPVQDPRPHEPFVAIPERTVVCRVQPHAG